MSIRFPVVTSKEIIKVLEMIGFVFVRQSGSSHAIYKRPADNRRTVIPMHAATTLKRRTLKAILTDAGLSVEEFRKLL